MALLVEETTNQIESQQIKSNVGFWWEGKPEYPGKNLYKQSREPTNSVYIWRRARKSIRSHFGGKRVLSALRQPCSALAHDLRLQLVVVSNNDDVNNKTVLMTISTEGDNIVWDRQTLRSRQGA